MQRRARRTVVALGVSLAVHALVLSLMRAKPAAPTPSSSPLVLTGLTWIDATSPHEERAPEASRPRGVSAAPSRTAPLRREASAAPGPATLTPPLRREASAAPEPAAPTSDAPSRIDLAPRATLVVPGDQRADAPRGRTLHPGDLPGVDELRADEQERVSTLVDGWARSGLAAARVRGGLPDPEYGQLGAALRKATDEVPRFIDTNSPKEVVDAVLQSWGAGAERYGKTGAPYAEPEGHLEHLERPSEVGRAASNGSPDGALDVVDLTNPTYDCRVSLVEAE